MTTPEPSDLEKAALADPAVMAAVNEARSDRLLTPAEVAAIFRVDPRTVTRWARIGVLTAIRPNPKGQRWYKESQVRNLLAGEVNGQNSEDNGR